MDNSMIKCYYTNALLHGSSGELGFVVHETSSLLRELF